MYTNQSGRCSVCEKKVEFSAIKVDHNHLTGQVRGLVCSRCNTGLAYIDDKTFLINAGIYLSKSNREKRFA